MKYSIRELIDELRANNCSIKLNKAGNIDLIVKDKSQLPKELVARIKENKQELIEYLNYSVNQIELKIEKVEQQENYAISDAQRRLWVLCQFEENSAAYIITGTIFLNKEVNLEYFKKAIIETVNRHEILRTFFKENEAGEVRQWIKEINSFDVEFDFRDLRSTENKTEAVRAYRGEDAQRGFDLENGPLFRTALLQVEDEQYVFYYNMHHIISDGWSMDVLSNDVFNVYEAYQKNTTPEFGPLKIQYKDYSAWQLAQLEKEEYRAHESYWRDSLSGELPVLDLPNSKKRPGLKSSKGHQLSTFFDEKITSQLKRFSEENGASLFMSLLASWNVLMYRYTGQNDLIIGTPVAGRDHKDLENQIGFYANTLALRNFVNPMDSFQNFFQIVKDKTLTAYSHQMYPFDRLVEKLNIERDPSRGVIFDLMLSLQNDQSNGNELELEANQINEIKEQTDVISKFDVGVMFKDLGKHLSLDLVYNPDLYHDDMVRQLIDHYKQLINALLENPNEKIGQVNYLLPSEKERLLKFGNASNSSSNEENVIQSFANQAKRNPTKTAVVFDGMPLSYQAIDERSNQLAAYLISTHGVVQHDLVAIKQTRSEWMIISILAVLKTGAAYVPIDPDYPEDRIKFISEDTQAKLCIDQTELNAFNQNSDQYSKTQFLSPIQSDDLAYLIYTSGSMGKPKAVMVSHQNLADKLIEEQEAISIEGEISTYCLTNYVFDVSLLEMILPLTVGGKVVISSKDNVEDLQSVIHEIIENEVNLLQGTPTYFNHFLSGLSRDSAEQLNKTLKTISVGGESLNGKLVQRFRESLPNVKLNNHYGPTEITIDAIVAENVISFEKNLIGKPLSNTKVYILDENLTIVPPHVTGEIIIGGSSVTKGYFRREQLTSEKFILNPLNKNERVYRTGDIGRWTNDGNIEFVGRKDEQVKIRGYRIEPGEIEQVLLQQKGVENAVVITKQNDNQEDNLVAYIQPKVNTFVSPKTNEEFLVKTFDGSKKMYFDMEKIHDNLWPDFFQGDQTVKTYWSKLYEEFAEHQAGVLTQGAKIVAVGNSIPIHWDGTADGLPIGWDAALKQGFDDRNNLKKQNTLCVLIASVHQEELGKGISYEVLKCFFDLAISFGYEKLIIPVRPTDKSLFPNMSLEEYCVRKNEAGKVGDNWLRVHLNLGGKIISYSNVSQEILGSVEQWEKWTGQRFDKSGKYEIEGAMQPIEIDLENNTGKYFDQCVWIEHQFKKEKENRLEFVHFDKCRSDLKETLPDYMIPSFMVQVAEFPVTSNGKIDKKALPHPDGLSSKSIKSIEPRNEIERTFEKIWKSVLNQKEVGILDDFFALGGHSLNAIRLSNAYLKEFGVKLSLNELFTHTTILAHREIIESTRGVGFEQIEAVGTQESYPISDAQRRLWVLSQFDDASAAYHMPTSIYLNHEVELNSFIKAINATIERHEILRTVFREDESGEIRQWIIPHEAFQFELTQHDFRSSGDKNARVEEFIQEDVQNLFDLEKGPLLRGALLQVEDREFVFYFIMHHIISDGWSMEVLSKDILAYYESYKRNVQPQLDPLRIQYKDYSAWQLNQLDPKNKSVEIHRYYWHNQFAGALPVLNLPTSNHRPKVKTYNGHGLRTYLNAELSEVLKSYSQKNGGSLFMTLLAAWNALMHRYTGQDDIIIGTPTTGRSHIELENQIGFYINALALRNDLKSEDSFNTFFQRLKGNTLEAYEHQSYPFDRLVEELDLIKDTSRSALFDILIVLQNSAPESFDLELKQTELDQITDLGKTVSKFDLEVSFQEVGAHVMMELKFNPDVYDQDMAEGLLQHFKQLTFKALSSPDERIALLEYLTESEKQEIVGSNKPKVDFPKFKTIVNLFENQVAQTPNSVAVVFENKELTYQELDELTNQFARYLKEVYHIHSNDLIAIKLERSEWIVISMLAILKSGGAYVPIDPSNPLERIAFIEKDANCKAIIDASELIKFAGSQKKYEKTTLNSEVDPNSLAYIIYTSGSTGKPKGVMIDHCNVVRLFMTDHDLFDFGRNDTWTMFHSYAFDFSVWEMYGALFFGGRLIIIPKGIAQDPNAYLELIKNEKVTVLNQTPSAFYNLSKAAEELDEDLNVRYVIFGGEALSPGRLTFWNNRFPNCKLVNMYGITEGTVHTTYKEIGSEEIKLNKSNIGEAIPTVKCLVLDENRNIVPFGVTGELYIGGYGVAKGYLNRKSLTEERFVPDPFESNGRLYRTGDSVRQLKNGDLEYLGRIDNQVKIRGHRIELGEIEHALAMHEELDQAAVIAIEYEEREKVLVAYLTSKTEQNSSGLRTYLSKQLPEYMLPTYYVQLDQMPLTNNGKIDKKALPNPEGIGIISGTEYIAPRNEIEVALIGIWESILKTEGIGIRDNFFANGGDSMKAIQIVAQIRKKLSRDIKVAELYKYDTVEGLAGLFSSKNTLTDNEDLAIGLTQLNEFKQTLYPQIKSNSFFDLYEDYYPVTQIEQGMIFSSMMNPDEPVYYDQFIDSIAINHIDKFKKAVGTIVQRHAILRTKYFMNGFDEPVKVVFSEVDIPLFVNDLSSLNKEMKEKKIQAFTQELLDTRLTFNNELLWSLYLNKVKENQYLVVFCFHHALLDGWSTSIFRSELSQLFASDNEIELPALKFSYQDYVTRLLGRRESAKTQAYWKEMLDGYVRNKLPFNYKGVKISEEQGMHTVRLPIDKAIHDQLENVAKNEHISSKAIFLGAHLYLLRIISTETDVVTGVVTHNRPEIEDAEKIMGCFLYTVPVRIDFDQIKNYRQLLSFAQNYLVEVKAHEVHLTDIVQFIDEKVTNGNPVFDTLLNYTDFHILNDLEASENVQVIDDLFDNETSISNEMTNTFFDLEVDKTGHQLGLKIKYLPRYFQKHEMEYALSMYARILEQLIKDLDQQLIPASLLLSHDNDFSLGTFNNTVTEYSQEKSLFELFEAQVERTPNAIALRQDGQVITYNELNNKANQLARKLVSCGVKPGENIGVLVDRNFDMITSIFAVLKCGGAYVPIDPEYPLDRQQYIMENSSVSTVVCDSVYPISDQLIHVEFINTSALNLSNFDTTNLGLKVDKHDLAYTIYTSGSTGRPKGVMIEHHSAVNLVEWVNTEFNIGQSDRMLFITSMCFDLSVYDIFGMLAAGGSIVIAKKEQVQNVKALSKILKDEQITFWDSVPTTMNYLIDELNYLDEVFEQKELRLVFLSGDWIPVQLPKKISTYFPNVKVISLGGATEGTVWSNYYPIKTVDKLWSSIPYGKPIANNYFYILDSNLNPVPPGVAGDLYIGGVGVARGYANDPAKTTASFVADPFNHNLGGRMYRTGDLGRMLVTGNMEFLGRADHQVKIRGFRVELGEIESILSQMDEIKEAVVDVVTDEQNNNQLAAYYVAKDNIDQTKTREYLQKYLPTYMIPSFFIRMEALPLTSNGKINRKALPIPSFLELDRLTEFVAPRNEIEEAIVEIWQEILGIDKIGVNDDFFELGGHSLAAIRLLTRVEKSFSVKIELKNLFIEPTISGLAAAVGMLTWMKEKSSETNSKEDQIII
jgi:amino acid adenylation domain-containing protein